MRPSGDCPAFPRVAWVDVSPAWEEAEVRSWTLSTGLMAREEVMQDLFKRLWRDDSGQDTTEYVLVVLLVVVTAGMLLLATSVLDTAPTPAIGGGS